MSELAVVSSLKDQVTPGLSAMLRSTRKWSTSMAGAVSGLARNFVSLRGAVVGVAAVWGARLFGSFVSSTAEAAAELAALSEAMGVTVESLSEMQYALGSVGLKAADASDLFRTFGRSIAQAAQGSAAQQSALQALGLDLEALKAGNIDLVALLGDVSEGLGRMGTQAEKTQALVALFGEKGQRLIPFLSQSREEIQKWSDEAKRMGVSVDAGMVGISTAFSNAKTKFQAAVTGVRNAILTEFYPVLTEGLNRMAEFMARNRTAIVEAVRSIASWTVEAFHAMSKAILDVADVALGISRALGLTNKGEAERARYIELIRQLNEAEDQLLELQQKRAALGVGSAAEEERRNQVLERQVAYIKDLQRQIEATSGSAFEKERAILDQSAGFLRSLLEEARRVIGQTPAGPAPSYQAAPPAPIPSFEDEDFIPPQAGPMDRTEGMGQVEEVQGEWAKFQEGMRQGTEDFAAYATDTTQIAKDTMGAALAWTTEIMSQGFADMVTGAKSAGQAFQEMGKGMLQMIAQLLIKMAMLKLMGGIFGSKTVEGLWGGKTSSAPAGAGFAPSMAAAGGPGVAGVGAPGGGGAALAAGGPVNVSFTIHANDAKGFRELLHRDRSMIEGLIQDAVSRRPVFRRAIGSA